MELQLYTKFRGHCVIDGGFSKPIPYRYKDTKKLFINVLPDIFYLSIPENCIMLNIHEVYGLHFPNDYWSWSAEFSDDMFLKGYLAGEKLKEKILQALNL